MATGRIYFIQGEAGGPIKIGFATDVAARIRGLQTGHHQKLVCLVHVSGTMDDERLLHRDFAAHRTQGEWFDDCAEIRALIDSVRTDVTAEGVVAVPEKEKTASKPREKMSRLAHDLFKLMAEQSFGRAGLAKSIAEAAGVGQKAGENLLAGKNDPSLATLINLCRSEPRMFLWFMSVVVIEMIAEQHSVSEEDALGMIGQFPEVVPGIYLSMDKAQTRTAIEILYLASKGMVSAPSLQFLEEFCRDSAAKYEGWVQSQQTLSQRGGE